MKGPHISPPRFLELEIEKARRKKEDARARPVWQSVEMVLKELVPTRSKDPLGGIQQIRGIWEQVVGQEIGKLTQPQRYKGGVLIVAVQAAPLAAELQSFDERMLVERLAGMGLEGVHSIRFQTGGLPDAAAGGEGCENIDQR